MVRMYFAETGIMADFPYKNLAKSVDKTSGIAYSVK